MGGLANPQTNAFSILRIGAITYPDTLNPFLAVSAASYAIWAHVYELPIAIGLDLTPVPSLVKSWEVAEDNLTWTWHLQEGVTWHDGVPLTAEDLNFTMRFMWVEDPGNPEGCDLTLLSGYLGVPDALPPVGIDIDNITVIDDYTIQMRTWQPKANILSMEFFVVPKHVWSKINCQQVPHVKNIPMIGSGMYRFKDYANNQFILLELNEQYWRLDPEEDYVDQIVYRYYGTDTQLFNALQAGDIDATDSLSADAFTQVPSGVGGGQDNVRKYAVDAVGFSEMGACVASDALIEEEGKPGGRSWLITNRTIRQALQIAVNRTVLVEKIKFGLASPGSTLIPPATPFWHYTPSPEEEFAYDPERARLLLNDPKGDGADLKADATSPGKYGEGLDPTKANNKDAFIDIDGDGVRDVVDPTQVGTGDWMGPAAQNRPLLSSQSGGGLTFDLSIITTDVEAQNAAESFMIGWWAEIGIKVVPNTVSWNRQLAITYDCSASLYSWGWGSAADPDFLLSIMITEQILYWQDAWYSNLEYDRLYALQQTQVNLAERQQTVWEMQRIVYRDAPYLIYWYDKLLTVVRTDRFYGWGDWEANPGLGLTGYFNDFLMLTLRAGTPTSNNPPTKPIIEGTPPITAFVGERQGFVGTASDPENDPLTWIWSWDDDSSTRNDTATGVSEVTANHTWAEPGSYNVTLTVDDSVNVVTSDRFQVIVIPRPAEVGWIAGMVRDESTTEPVGAAIVAVSPGGFSQPTNSQGAYNITVPVGTYSVTASHDLYSPATESGVAVTEGKTTTVDLELTPSRGWIAGTVTSSSGGALAGVSIRASGPREYLGTTNANGGYNITVAPATYSVEASLDGYVDKTTTGVLVSDGATTTIDFVLDPISTGAPGLSPLGVIGISLGVLTVVVALVAWAVVRRRKKAEEMEAPTLPPKPPSAP